MKRIALAATAAVIALTGIAATGGPDAQAGTPQVNVRVTYSVFDPDSNAPEIVDGLTAEVFDSGGAPLNNPCTETPDPSTTTVAASAFASRIFTCLLESGAEHTLGVDGVPDDKYVSDVFCDQQVPNEPIDDPNATFTAVAFLVCNVAIQPVPVLYIDKVVVGGDAAPADFTIEIFDAAGSPVGSVVDDAEPSSECDGFISPANTACANIGLTPGDYRLGEVSPEYGYSATSVECSPLFQETEVFPSPFGDVTHSTEGEDTYCLITNTYYEQTVSVDVVVTNDDGGAATAADFTIEVYDAAGVLVDSGIDPEPGEGNASAEFTLPIGDYTFGVTGPAGYETTIVVTVEQLVGDIIGDGSGDFSLTPGQTVSAVLAANDPTTTTTTTTTVAPTTTEAATTTTFDDGSGAAAPTTTPTTVAPQLPATGDDGSGMMALLALALVMFGSGVVFLARRS